jgi:LysR family transcriptional regulator, nod-box dependent transcriptional activator
MKMDRTEPNPRKHNLNNLPVLLEILRRGSLTRAAEELGLTQPALSNILRQLRIDFGDELIERRGRTMQLTPRAERLVDELDGVLGRITDLIEDRGFLAESASGPIRIATTDHIMQALATPLVRLLEEEAPGIRAELMLANAGSPRALLLGELDIIITPRMVLRSGADDQDMLNEVRFESLMVEQMLCLGRADDEGLKNGLTLDAYLARTHVGFILDSKLPMTVERAALAHLGETQTDRLLVSSYFVLPRVVLETGALALVPEGLAEFAMRYYPLQAVRPPISIPPIDWVMVWPRRKDDEPRSAWLRSILKRSLVPYN